MDALSKALIAIPFFLFALTACVPSSLPDNSDVSIEVSKIRNSSIQLSTSNSSLPISNLKWNFGDGYSADGDRVQHRYLSAGEYTVTLNYEQDNQSKTQTTVVNIQGESDTIVITPSTHVSIDSDHNDPNQPFRSNNEEPQWLTTPTTLSGILLDTASCQAGRLCSQGDHVDRYIFDLKAGQFIKVASVKGSLDVKLYKHSGELLHEFNNVETDLTIHPNQLNAGRYQLTLYRPYTVEKVLYRVEINDISLDQNSRHQPGKLIIQWKNNPVPELVDIQDPRLHKTASAISARSELKSDERIEHVSLNYYRYPSIAELEIWQWPLLNMNIENLWTPLLSRGYRPGDQAIVAVLDTGLFSQHDNFQNTHFVDGYDFVSDIINSGDGNGWDRYPEDPGDSRLSYHGTHVTGIISATPNWEKHNDSTQAWVSGAAYGTTIMPLRVLGLNGGTSYDLIQALRYAAKLPNDSGRLPSKAADVINLSLGGPEFSVLEQTVFQEVIQTGAIVVAAAGNQNRTAIDYPAAYPGVISVGATDRFQQRADYSNTGHQLKVMAPGGDCNTVNCSNGILSLGASGSISESGFDNRSSTWKRLSGTSMATAHVSALFAIAKSQLPGLDADTLLSWLKSGELTPQASYTPQSGYGEISTEKLLNKIDSSIGLDQGIWSNKQNLYLNKNDSQTIHLTQRGEDNLEDLILEFNQERLVIKRIDNQLTIQLLQTLESIEPINILFANQALRIYIHPVFNDALPSFSDHLYVELSDQLQGLRTIRDDNQWLVRMPPLQNDSFIQASTDIDYDGVYCEPGEFCALSDTGPLESKRKIWGEIIK